jgi:hypothetical protein
VCDPTVIGNLPVGYDPFRHTVAGFNWGEYESIGQRQAAQLMGLKGNIHLTTSCNKNDCTYRGSGAGAAHM